MTITPWCGGVSLPSPLVLAQIPMGRDSAFVWLLGMVGGSLYVYSFRALGGLFMLGPGAERYLPLGLLHWVAGSYSLPVTPSTDLLPLLSVGLTDLQPGRPMSETCPFFDGLNAGILGLPMFTNTKGRRFPALPAGNSRVRRAKRPINFSS